MSHDLTFRIARDSHDRALPRYLWECSCGAGGTEPVDYRTARHYAGQHHAGVINSREELAAAIARKIKTGTVLRQGPDEIAAQIMTLLDDTADEETL